MAVIRVLATLAVLAVAVCGQAAPTNPVTVRARVILTGKSSVSGVLNLTETSDQAGVRITGRITGLTPGQHGFHIHEFGDVFTKGCDSAGPHFNPTKALHGSPTNDANSRHAGDLGNLLADDKGVAEVDIVDTMITLMTTNCNNPNNILGRAFVVHEKVDDLGKGGDEGSSKTGNAGGRLACGIIALVAGN